METTGIQCDRQRLDTLGVEFQKRMDDLAARIYELAGHSFKIESPKQLGTVLFDELGLKGGKNAVQRRMCWRSCGMNIRLRI